MDAWMECILPRLGFKELTDIQKKVIPYIQKGRNLVVEARTGSGKTHSYLLPLFARRDDLSGTSSVIVSPTADLAEQTFRFARELNDIDGNRQKVSLFSGGRDREAEIEGLIKASPTMVVGTPGRLADLIAREKALDVHKTKTLVIDEADMAMDEGFLESIDKIASAMARDVQILVFSATIPEAMTPFLKKYLMNPEFIRMNEPKDQNQYIEHLFVKTREQDRIKVLDNILGAINPYLAIIFCNRLDSSEAVYGHLREKGFEVVLYNGDVESRKRRRIIQNIERLDYQYIVATDLLSRGIDIDSVSHIINFELPRDVSQYIHRSGRTGRMGKEGINISLYEFADNAYIEKLESLGIACSYREVRDGSLELARARNERAKRVAPQDKQQYVTRKQMKVKPRYKAKMKETSRTGKNERNK